MATINYNQAALTGNLVTLRFGNSLVGLIQNMSVQEDLGLMPVSGIGDVMPVEHAPGIGRINISCESIYIIGPTTASNGTAQGYPANLQNKDLFDALGIAPKNRGEILDGRVFTIDVYGGPGGRKHLRQYTECSYGSGSISFQKHQLVVRNATFMATGFQVDPTASA